MDADNDDRPHYHNLESDNDGIYDINPLGCLYPCPLADDYGCCDDDDARYILTADEYRALVAAARDRHPAGQQRGPDPATRADNCICWGYGDDHHTACPACTP